MKIGNVPDYVVQVFRPSDGEEPEEAAQYEGVFTVVLNVFVHITFIPAIDLDAPPWPADQEPPDNALTSPERTRWYELVTGTYSVTPSATRAGQVGRIGPLDPPSTVFYVTPEEFAVFTRELAELAERTGGLNASPQRSEVLDRAVMRFIDEQVLNSPSLRPTAADVIGRGSVGGHRPDVSRHTPRPR